MKMFAIIGLVLLTGCRFGSADFEGEVNGHDFEADGTVFSFEDATDSAGLQRETPILRIVMMYIAVDPLEDLSQKSGDELDRLRHENGQRDGVDLTIIDASQLIAGEALEQERVGAGGATTDDDFVARVQFRPEVLDDTSTYADFVPVGSLERIRFSATALEDDAVSGDLSIDIVRAEGDAANASTLAVTGSFTAPTVPEAIAEKNLNTLRWPLRPVFAAPGRP